MNIKDLIPAVVEEIADALDDCRERGLCVVAPETVDIEMQLPHGSRLSVQLRVLGPELREPKPKPIQ